jgi:HlyD family secretion protein
MDSPQRKFFVSDNGKEKISVDKGELQAGIDSGKHTDVTLAWTKGMSEWLPLSDPYWEKHGIRILPPPPGSIRKTNKPPFSPIPVSKTGKNENPVKSKPRKLISIANAKTSQPKKISGIAIASLVCGLLCIPIVSIVLGHIAKSQIKKSKGTIYGKGIALAGLILGYLSITAPLGLGVALYWWTTAPSAESATPGKDAIEPLYEKVIRGEFKLEFTEPGEIEIGENVEINCEVKSRSSESVSILEIVREGTVVEKGDFLVKLDDAVLQKDLLSQRISVHKARASLVKAKADIETTELALDEYMSGSFRQEEEQMESAEFVARENLRRAEEYLTYSKKLAAKGYLPEAQLEADQFAVEKARKELDLAMTKLEVLKVHSHKAKVNDLNASILTAWAQLKSSENSFELEATKEREINDQIAKCVILSPAAGEVTYANRSNSGSADGILIEEGKPVRERQTIIRLSNPSLMRVRAKVNGNRVAQVKPGMLCTITIDVFRGITLSGKVDSVSDYPLALVSGYTSNIKEYSTEIIIEHPPEGIRSGMSAKVTILLERQEDVLQIPLTAVIRKEGQSFCIVKKGKSSLSLRLIEIGTPNLTHALLLRGLSEGEEVVVNPNSFPDVFKREDWLADG